MLKSRLVYLVVFLFSVLLIIFYEDKNIGFTVLYVLVFLLMLSLFTLIIAPFVIRIDEKSQKGDINKGDNGVYELEICNKSFCYYPKVAINYKNDKVVSYRGRVMDTLLLPFGKKSRDLTIVFPYRGVYEFGIESMVVMDFLGLFKRKIIPKRAQTITVYPKLLKDLTIPLVNDLSDSILDQRRFDEDYAVVSDVRKYENTDNIKRIHWKLSAKRNELMVKNFQSLNPNRTFLYLDALDVGLTGGRKAMVEDTVISYIATAVDYCMQSRFSLSMIYGSYKREVYDIEPTSDMLDILGKLASVEFYLPESKFSSFCASVDSKAASYNLVLFALKINEDILTAIKEFSAQKHNVVVFCFFQNTDKNSAENEENAEKLKALNIAVYNIKQ